MIVIHKPTIDDYDAVRALVAEVHALHHAARSDVYAADAHFSREYYAALLADENGFPIAAYDGDKLVGFASAFMKPANPNRPAGRYCRIQSPHPGPSGRT